MGFALSSVLWLEDWPNVPVSQDSLWWLTDTLVKVKYSKLVQNYTYTTSSQHSCQKTLLKLSYHTNQSLIGLNHSCIAVIPKGSWQEIFHDPNITVLPEDLLPSASLIHNQLLSFSPDYNNKQWPQPWVRQLRSLTIHLSVWSDTFTTCLFTVLIVLQTIYFKVFPFHLLNLSWRVLIKLPCTAVTINRIRNTIFCWWRIIYLIYSI